MYSVAAEWSIVCNHVLAFVISFVFLQNKACAGHPAKMKTNRELTNSEMSVSKSLFKIHEMR